VKREDRTQQAGRPRRLGEGDRCAVCGATSGVSEDDGTYQCLVCGAPRVLVDGIVQRRGTEKPLLERAKSLRLRRSAYAVVGGLALVLGVVSLTFSSVAALFFGAGGAKGLVFGVASLVPLAVSLVAWIAARRSTTGIRDALSDAELVVAKELIASGGARDATRLAQLMHLPAGRAEEMFGRAEVERLLDVPVDELPIERVRVSTDEDISPDDEVTAQERFRNR